MIKFEYLRLEAIRTRTFSKDGRMLIKDEHTIMVIEPNGSNLDVHDKTLTEVLNYYGEQGWELVTSTETYFVDEKNYTSSNYCNCILKRQVL